MHNSHILGCMTNPDKNPKTEEGAVAASNSPAVTSDEYQTVDEKLESASATSQLQDMLGNEDFAPHEMTEPGIEIAADDDAPIDWTIVGLAGVLIAAIVTWGLAAPTNFANFASDALSFVVNDFGWAYVLFGTIFVVFVVFIAASKFGTIRLGHIDEEPEFSTPSWIAMMFAALRWALA